LIGCDLCRPPHSPVFSLALSFPQGNYTPVNTLNRYKANRRIDIDKFGTGVLGVTGGLVVVVIMLTYTTIIMAVFRVTGLNWRKVSDVGLL